MGQNEEMNPAFGFEAILKYANNLYNQPWRSEYKKIRTYSGYFQHEVQKNLMKPEQIFLAMGYVIGPDNTLVMPGNVCPDQLQGVAYDALIAISEYKIIKRILKNLIAKKGIDISLDVILEIREKYTGSIDDIIDIIIQLKNPIKPDKKTNVTSHQYANVNFNSNGKSSLNSRHQEPFLPMKTTSNGCYNDVGVPTGSNYYSNHNNYCASYNNSCIPYLYPQSMSDNYNLYYQNPMQTNEMMMAQQHAQSMSNNIYYGTNPPFMSMPMGNPQTAPLLYNNQSTQQCPMTYNTAPMVYVEKRAMPPAQAHSIPYQCSTSTKYTQEPTLYAPMVQHHHNNFNHMHKDNLNLNNHINHNQNNTSTNQNERLKDIDSSSSRNSDFDSFDETTKNTDGCGPVEKWHEAYQKTGKVKPAYEKDYKNVTERLGLDTTSGK